MQPKYLGGLFVLGAIWGAAFMLIKISVGEIGPAALVAIRLVIAVLLLLAVLYLRGLRLPTSARAWGDFFVAGFIGVVLPFTLITWGQQFIPSSLTGILNGAVPLFSVLLGYFWAGEERFGGLKLLGLCLGFAGVIMAVGPEDLSLASSGTQGQLAVLGATLCYAVTGLYARRAFRGMPPLIPATGQLLTGALVMLVATPFLGGYPSTLPSAQAIGAVLTLAVLCTAVAYILLYWIMDNIGATRTSMVTYLIAPFGLLFGALFLNERVQPGALAGLALVITGILLTNGVIRLPNRGGSAGGRQPSPADRPSAK
jgi:drug/metabolite transporter (DMT)-like permease